MEAQRYISVITTTPRSVPSYLYGHTVIMDGSELDLGNGLTGLVLVTTADSQDRADYLAEYQAGRLASGMHGASVWPTAREATDRLLEYAS